MPLDIPIRFDASGDPTQISPRTDLVRLPFIGLLLLLVDTGLGLRLHAREKLLARLGWVSGWWFRRCCWSRSCGLLQ